MSSHLRVSLARAMSKRAIWLPLESSKLLIDYKSAAQSSRGDKNSALITDALEKAVQRVNTLQEPENSTVADVFVIRNIYDDPELKAMISSCFSSGQQRKLSKVISERVLEQPIFPPHCWAILNSSATQVSRLPWSVRELGVQNIVVGR